jgi:membrane dipeptidase
MHRPLAPLVWDAHSCLPLKRGVDITALDRHRAAGIDYVSINIAMDFNPWPDTLRLLAYYRARLAEHPERYRLVGTVEEVRRAKADGVLAVTFDIEGAVVLDQDLDLLALYADLGVRQIHFAYNRNNAIGGGCHDAEEGRDCGLTPFGHQVLAAVNRLGLLIDCSHTGLRTSLDIMAASTRPVVFSHANPRAIVDHPRNITDEQIRACAATGGVVGINGVGVFLGDPQAGTAAMARAVEYVGDLVGRDHVGFGLDFNWLPEVDDAPEGLVREDWWPAKYGYASFADMSFARPEQIPELAEALAAWGWSDAELAGVMGGNFLRAAEATWPQGR